MADTGDPLAKLAQILSRYNRVAVAFSGGVDSTLLAVMAHRSLKGAALAVTARTPLMARRELEAAECVIGDLGIHHQWVEVDLLADPEVKANVSNRCYYCKRHLFRALADTADALGYTPLIHGANADDDGDYRPGQQAAREMGVAAPLMEAGMTKKDVRAAARDLGLPNWNKPAMACLASRIPYGEPLSLSLLRRVAKAEALVMSLGVGTCRVRVHGPVARIEVPVDDQDKITRPEARSRLVTELRQLGFDHVSLDLEGLVTGSLNRAVCSGEGRDNG